MGVTPYSFVGPELTGTATPYSFLGAAALESIQFCDVLFQVDNEGLPLQGAECTAQLLGTNNTIDGYLIGRVLHEATADVNGNATLRLIPHSEFTSGGVYLVKVTHKDVGILFDRNVEVPTATTANAEDLRVA